MTRQGNTTPPFRPYWFDEALKRETELDPTPLTGDIDADVCIVGGGYTGLWTALMLKEKKPDLSITIIEQDLCGYGASGCNGGCVLTLATKFQSLCQFYGEKEAIRIVVASENAVDEMKAFTEKHDIDCDFRLDGVQYIATNQAQVGAMDTVVEALERAGINSWSKRSIPEGIKFAGTHQVLEAYYSERAGSLQPALLVRGMARVAREMGVQIYEQTPMSKLVESRPQAQVVTPKGSIRAKKVVLAINAWMPTHFRKFARSIAIVSSDMGITEPIPDKLKEIQLDHGATICDSRLFVHYYHTTSDGRLLFGKGGNTFAFGGRMLASFFQPSVYRQQITNAIQRFFPSLASTRLEQVWNGASDRSTTGFPFFGNLNEHPNIHYGFGYSGNGVTQCWLGGQILTSLCLNQEDEWSRCGFVGGPLGHFPPEPFRWIGSIWVRNAIRRKETAEDAGRKPNPFDVFMARFAEAAGKTDH